MTRQILGVLLVFIFVCLGSLQIDWALGGQTGSGAAVPQAAGKPLFVPSVLQSVMVAAALFGAALVVSGTMGWLGSLVPPRVFRAFTLATSLVFLLRAIGDFRYVGFFRSASESAFATRDAWVYSPLCLWIAISAFLVAWRQA